MDDDSLFRALADPTRRAIFERLATGPSNASGLREGFGISQPAMSQHLGVLVGAGLVRQERELGYPSALLPQHLPAQR